MIVPALFVGALFLVVFLRQPNGPEPSNQWVLTGQTMGTAFTVKIVVPPGSEVGQSEVEGAIRDAVDAVDFVMSTYRDDSELSRFNRHGTEPFQVSESMIEVVSEARRVAELSAGAFDVTVGPLVDAWGFGPDPVADPPDAETIAALLAYGGFDKIDIDPEQRTLIKDDEAIRCDLSAIAKGYAVDRVAHELVRLGLTDFMVEIGGEVRASGRKTVGEAWRIGIERPEAGPGGLWSAVTLVDTAMATSGDYRNYYERDGVRISHTIDPRIGHPITHKLASVSVIHPSCMTADALATALSVLGPEDGRAMVEREGLAALFLIRAAEGGFEEWASDGWPGENSAMAVDVDSDEDE
jgi:thiamine biosynthesis lipoprotein